jgi:CheY-like chemotaxis protein
MSVLLVDDDETVRSAIAQLLQIGGFRVATIESGEGALAYLESHPQPDIVIMDQNMPGLSGLETMERIHARNHDLPVLIATGQLEIEDHDCFKCPNAGVIFKPFDLAEIKARLVQFT